jgi:hypothetical protein
MTRVHRWRVVLILTVIGVSIEAQESFPRDSTFRFGGPDTVRAPISSAVTKDDSLAPPPSRSPLLAMGLSALIPGGGQIYNRSYWKVPLILGLGGYFVYEFIDNHRQYKDYRDRYQAGLATYPDGDRRILALREFYKEQRDSFGWYFLILYVVNLADAYVDASLFGFDVGDNLGFRAGPLDGPVLPAGPSVTIRFWLR